VKVGRQALLLLVLLFAPVIAHAQDFGVMNSAETINPGNVKLAAAPLFMFGQGDDDIGLSLFGGYGLTSRIDVEGRIAIYDDVSYIGADVEYWILKNRKVDLSATLGFHAGLSDFYDSKGADVTITASRRVRPNLAVYGALDMAFNDIDDIDDDYRTGHLVPGVEYKLRPNIEFVAELGVGLTDDSKNYVSAGFVFYLR
jgi:hypothetical protein